MVSPRLSPRAEIRRFDVFAEWNRIKARTQPHCSEADARAYGLAVAKVVAARKGAGARPAQRREGKRHTRHEDRTEAWWEHLGLAREFEQKIVGRMGKSFYRGVFRPAVRRA
jgi:hypothetical protein